MKTKYEAPKGQRIKSRSFIGLQLQTPTGNYWYFKDLKKWVDLSTLDENLAYNYSNTFRTKGDSLKAYIRAVNKFKFEVPKGSRFAIMSLYVGQNVYITV